eukprot:gene5395-6545_t
MHTQEKSKEESVDADGEATGEATEAASKELKESAKIQDAAAASEVAKPAQETTPAVIEKRAAVIDDFCCLVLERGEYNLQEYAKKAGRRLDAVKKKGVLNDIFNGISSMHLSAGEYSEIKDWTKKYLEGVYCAAITATRLPSSIKNQVALKFFANKTEFEAELKNCSACNSIYIVKVLDMCIAEEMIPEPLTDSSTTGPAAPLPTPGEPVLISDTNTVTTEVESPEQNVDDKADVKEEPSEDAPPSV